jgi:hypothetical protein
MVSSFYIKKYLDKSLEDQFFKKIQQLDEKTFRIQFNRSNLYFKIGEGFEISNKTLTGKPSNFCMFLRKKLGNFKLKKIYQYEFDRIIVLEFEKFEKYFLIVELFGKGDLILCDKELNIITSYSGKKGKYEFPEKNYYVISEIDLEKFKEIIKRDEPISKILARDFGIGRKYSEYLCKITGLDPKEKGSNIMKTEELYENFLKMFEKPPVEEIEKKYEIKIEQKQGNKNKQYDKKAHIIEHYKKHLEKYENYKKIAETIINNIDFFEKIIELYKNKKIEDLKKIGVKIKDVKLFIDFDHCLINNNKVTD